ncbi:MAG: DNA replication/repair protein RecF [Verrucomicrobiales bacterium]
MLSAVELQDFRCFSQIHLELGPETTWILGRNGEGKSSLLEAACVLLRLQSPRTSKALHLVRHGRPGFRVAGKVEGHLLSLVWQGGKRSMQVDGLPESSSADYLSFQSVVWFGSDDRRLVTDGADLRRRYLDFLGPQLEPSYSAVLRRYERALKARNQLLKMPSFQSKALHAFDEPLLAAGYELITSRERLVKRLQQPVQASYAEVSLSEEALGLAYESLELDQYRQQLSAAEPEDRRLRHTTVGPHRDDLGLYLDQQPAALVASEGQKRSVALALKLGQASVLAQPPLLLIDDVFGELDHERRLAFLQCLPQNGQRVISTTGKEWLGESSGETVYRLAAGQLTLVD